MDNTIINFHSADIDFQLENESLYHKWLFDIAQSHKRVIGEINYIFCSDTYLIDINKKHLNHDTYTDIITFPYCYEPIESDIYISIDRIQENAKLYDVTPQKELHRVMAHGLLHLIGFNDKSEVEKSEMRRQEDKTLEAWNYIKMG